MTSDTQHHGFSAEALAKKHLQRAGLQWITSNYHCYFGEIDLIMKDHHTLVFIEVRLRNNANFGSGIESISQHKQQRIIITAKHYLQQYQLTNHIDCRFDAIGIQKNKKITWIKNAFNVQY